MKDIARSYFIGNQGNCAQSVAFALYKKGKASEDAIEKMASCGTGRAPDRMCGALYAALQYAPNSEIAIEIQKKFEEASGGFFKCPQIRVAKKLRCAQCVELASELIESCLPG